MVVALNVAKTLTESQNQQDDVRLVEEALFRSCRRACPTGGSDEESQQSGLITIYTTESKKLLSNKMHRKMKSLEVDAFDDREMMLERT